MCALGWSDAVHFVLKLVMLYQTVIGPQIQNFSLKCYFLTGAGPLRASEKFTVTLKWANYEEKHFWEHAPGGNVF